MRHGEVHNPDGVLYGRMPGFGLSGLGHEMARTVASHFADHDIVHVVSSPLQRALETAGPIAERAQVEIVTDPRVVEAANAFEGEAVGMGEGLLTKPRLWHLLRNPFTPSWGEPYEQVASRMLAAIADARAAASGREAVIVSHQLPVWTARLRLEGRRLWHDPRRRECTLASLTSLHYLGDELESIAYSEPAIHLLGRAATQAGA
ncbi:MAG: histidine phosphatase family protein [Dermatophilaceae bacterium]